MDFRSREPPRVHDHIHGQFRPLSPRKSLYYVKGMLAPRMGKLNRLMGSSGNQNPSNLGPRHPPEAGTALSRKNDSGWHSECSRTKTDLNCFRLRRKNEYLESLQMFSSKKWLNNFSMKRSYILNNPGKRPSPCLSKVISILRLRRLASAICISYLWELLPAQCFAGRKCWRRGNN